MVRALDQTPTVYRRTAGDTMVPAGIFVDKGPKRDLGRDDEAKKGDN